MKENDEFLVDTNILVYAYDTFQGEKHTKAKEIVERKSLEGRRRGYNNTKFK